MEKSNVGILIFENVEVLDFAGPFEVFSRTRTVAGLESRRSDDDAPFRVFTVAKTTDPVFATGALKVVPEYSLDADIVVDRNSRYVDDGIITSAGVSAGIDMAFYVVERHCGREVADETAQYIDYSRSDCR